MLVQKLCLPLNRDNQVATDGEWFSNAYSFSHIDKWIATRLIQKQEGLMIPFYFFVFTLFWVHHGFNTCKLLLIEFLTNLLQDFFLGLEGKSSESCFLPKERQTDRDCVGLLFVFGWNNSLWVLLPAILFSLDVLGLMGFTIFLLMPDFCASSECWKWVVVVVLCRSQTWWGGGDMGQVCGLYQVDQSIVAVKEKFGKFSIVLSPGCHCVPWCCGVNVAGVLSLHIQ